MVHGYFTVGEAAAHFGCQGWQVRRVYEKHLLPEPPRLGPYRVIPTASLPKLEEVLIKCGYLPAKETA